MPRMTASTVAGELAAFDNRHGSLIQAALRVYSEHMTGEAAAFQAEYDAIKNDPDRRAAQDATMVTANGLARMAQMCRESAASGDAASTAYSELTELLEGLGL